MASISSAGIGSGLDVNSIITQLMSLERAPINQLQKKEASFNTKISAFGSIRSLVDTLKTKSTAMADANQLAAFKTTVGNTDVFKASGDSSASAGKYDVVVTRLAQAHKLSANTNFSGVNDAVGAGTLSISVGGGTAVDVTTTGSATLGDLRDAINASAAGVTANLVTADSGTKLVLTAKEGGQAVTLNATDSDGTGFDFTQLGSVGSNYTTHTTAQTALLTVDSQSITSNSNTISGAIKGVTLTLAAAGTTTLEVARDSSTVAKAADEFVSAYNALNSKIKELTKYDAATQKGSTLTGDSTVRSLQSQFSDILTTVQSGITGSYSSLSNIGITLQRDGSMAVNSGTLQNAIDTDFNSVSSVLTTYGSAFKTATTNVTASDGLLSARTDSLSNTVKDFGKRKESLELRMEAIEKRYRAQYASLDTIISGMQTTSSFLTQQLARF